jgi:hypothetical protein
VKRGAAVSAAGAGPAGGTGSSGVSGVVHGVTAMPAGLAPTVIEATTARVATSIAETEPGLAFEFVT